jgi:hypothetical protein
MAEADEPRVGETWRDRGASPRFVVVDLDDRFVYVKRSDTPKKNLARPAGSYPVGRQEWARDWIRVD